MSWSNSNPDWKDRLFAALVYLFPLYYSLQFAGSLFRQIPFLELILIPLFPLIWFNQVVPFGGLILFFVLFAAVVRNARISHFIRFNTMQAILIDILLLLVSLVTDILLRGLGTSLFVQTLFNTIFLAVLAVCVYGMYMCAMGQRPEIPTISEAAYSQVPW